MGDNMVINSNSLENFCFSFTKLLTQVCHFSPLPVILYITYQSVGLFFQPTHIPSHLYIHQGYVSPLFVCLLVSLSACLSACLQDISKVYEQILMKLSGKSNRLGFVVSSFRNRIENYSAIRCHEQKKRYMFFVVQWK